MQTNNFKFNGTGKEYFGIWIVNVLLSIITLGIYSAWAKVRTNKYFYGNTELDGDKFTYLAQPKRILIGRIIATIGLIAWIFINTVMPPLAAFIMLVVIALFPILYVRSVRFEMKMTQYRNIRFNFNGSYGQAYRAILLKPLAAYIAIGVLVALDIALIQPISLPLAIIIGVGIALLLAPLLFAWVIAGINQYTLASTRYGNLEFSTSIQTKDIFPIVMKFFLMMVIFIGLIAIVAGLTGILTNTASAFSQGPAFTALMFTLYTGLVSGMIFIQVYFQTGLRNYIFTQTKLDESIQLKSTMTVMPCLKLVLTNIILIVITFGFAIPFVQVRTAKYVASISHLDGDLSLLNATEQVDNETGAIADEVSNAVDIALGIA